MDLILWMGRHVGLWQLCLTEYFRWASHYVWFGLVNNVIKGFKEKCGVIQYFCYCQQMS